MDNDKQISKAKKAEASKQDAGPLQRSSIEEFWKAFENRQEELMRETRGALSEIINQQ